MNATQRKIELRKQAVERADGKCEQCGKGNIPKKNYHLHHDTYIRLGNEKLEDVRMLCRGCHFSWHNKHKNTDDTNKNRTTVTVTVPKKLRKQWKKLAIQSGRSLSAWIRVRLEEALRELKDK